MLEHCNKYVDSLISQINAHLNLHQPSLAHKPCAEKSYSAELLRRYKQHGSQFRVNGVINYMLYPFTEDTNTMGIPQTISPPTKLHELEDGEIPH